MSDTPRTPSRLICRAALLVLGLAAVVLTATGCAHRIMPTPISLRGSHAPLPNARPVIEVFYATDRKPTRSNSPHRAYSNDRSLSLRLGIAQLRLGRFASTPDSLAAQLRRNERPTLALRDLNEIGELGSTLPITDPRGFNRVITGEPDAESARAERAFIERINQQLGPGGRVLVYVPGFNTSFEDAVLLVGELGLFLEEGVVPIAFSWPARANFFGYTKQLTNAEVSTRSLRELLTFLADHTEAERIDVMSYSAGATMVTNALHQLRLMHQDLEGPALRERLKIGTVIYAGADEDTDRFRTLYLDDFGAVAENITLYSSSLDVGLLISRFVARGSPRLGRAVSGLTEFERELLKSDARTSFVDVTYAQQRAGGGGFWSHAYWFGNPWVSNDVITQLRPGGTPSPAERGLELLEDAGVWRFPKDYRDRATQPRRE